MIHGRTRGQQAAAPLPGFERLVATCCRLGLVNQLAGPAASCAEAERRLSCRFDPMLRALLGRANGGALWEFHFYGVGNPCCELISLNENKRAARPDLKLLLDLVIFCKLGYRPEFVATVPSLASPAGCQPVAWLDLHDGIKLLPVASCVDRLLDMSASCLESLAARYGTVEDGASEERFPWDFAALASGDDALLTMLAAGAFDRFVTPHPDVIEWISILRGGRCRGDLH